MRNKKGRMEGWEKGKIEGRKEEREGGKEGLVKYVLISFDIYFFNNNFILC